MYNLLRVSIALCLLTTVASAAVIRNFSVDTTIEFPGSVTARIMAAGANGQLRGRGQLRLFRTAIYPITVTTGSISDDTIILAGFVKRQGVLYPYDLEITKSTGEATMEISDETDTSVVSTLDGFATTKVR